MHNYKTIIFDLDNTLTASRSLISKDMRDALMKLREKYNICIISGAELSQIQKQIPGLAEYKFYLMPQSGNIAIDPDKKELWNFKMGEKEKSEILKHINRLKKEFVEEPLTSEDDTIEIRGSQITYSAIGHNAPFDKKVEFDPDGEKRKMWLEKIPAQNDLIEARVAGTTSIDYTIKNRNKGNNIVKLMDIMKWKPEECLYIGDALSSGGNDETVIGDCDTKQVKDYKETLEIIKNLIE